MRRRAGFTLIEMVVIMATMGAMMAIIVPRLRTSPKQYVNMAARQLVRDLELTRSRALSVKRRTRVCFSPSTGGDYAGFLDHNNDGSISENSTEVLALQGFGIRVHQNGVQYGRGSASAIPTDAGSGSVTLSSNDVEFDSRGIPFPFGETGTVYLRHRDDANAVAAVQVQASGAFRLWRWQNGAWQ
jgi:Tfp pilus assembly protein FimT